MSIILKLGQCSKILIQNFCREGNIQHECQLGLARSATVLGLCMPTDSVGPWVLTSARELVAISTEVATEPLSVLSLRVRRQTADHGRVT